MSKPAKVSRLPAKSVFCWRVGGSGIILRTKMAALLRERLDRAAEEGRHIVVILCDSFIEAIDVLGWYPLSGKFVHDGFTEVMNNDQRIFLTVALLENFPWGRGEDEFIFVSGKDGLEDPAMLRRFVARAVPIMANPVKKHYFIPDDAQMKYIFSQYVKEEIKTDV